MTPSLHHRARCRPLPFKHPVFASLPSPPFLSLSYVDKDEAYLPYMTVREVLEFSAALRIGKQVTAEQRKAVVDEVKRRTVVHCTVTHGSALQAGAIRKLFSRPPSPPSSLAIPHPPPLTSPFPPLFVLVIQPLFSHSYRP